MRADLIVIPLREPVCDQCVEAFTANLFARLPEDRRGEDAEAGGDGASAVGGSTCVDAYSG
jgi:hypothetical protein